MRLPYDMIVQGGANTIQRSPEELRSRPDLGKTTLCAMFMRGNKCPFEASKCKYAPGERWSFFPPDYFSVGFSL